MASLIDKKRILLGGRLRSLFKTGWGARALLLLGFAALELYSRRADSVGEEIVSVIGLVTLTLQVWKRIGLDVRESPRLQTAQQWLNRYRIRFGVDLREDPPLPTRVPWAQVLVFTLVLAIGVLLFVHREAFPGAALAWLRGISGVLATAVTAALWSTLLLGLFGSTFLPVSLLESELRESTLAPRHRDAVMLWSGGLQILVLLSCALFLPLWLAPAIAFTGVLSGAWLFVPGSPPLRFAWRSQAGGPAAQLPTPLWLFGWRLFHFAGLCTLLLLSAGELFEEPDRLGATGFLGIAFAWGLALASGILALREVCYGWPARLANPARRSPLCIAVQGAQGIGQEQMVRDALGCAGFRVRFVAELGEAAQRRRVPGTKLHWGRAEQADAEIVLCEGPDPQMELDSKPPPWPRRVALADINDDALHTALRRRAAIQARRRLRRGFQRLFRNALRRFRGENRGAGGIGHWVAPHLWFIVHMGRDGDDELETVGPAYHSLFSASTRRHCYDVFRAVDVDLIFVEDGVDFRRFQRVLAMIFEFHDMFGERPLEARHFSGIPGVRVLIENLCLDDPLRGSHYPEPDYEQLARARVMHVFRDRGEDSARELFDPVEDHLVPEGHLV